MPTAKQLAEADRLLTEAELARFDGMSDAALRAAWDWDTDALWPSEAELAEFRRAGDDVPAEGKAAAE